MEESRQAVSRESAGQDSPHTAPGAPSPSMPDTGGPLRTLLCSLARRLVTWYMAPLLGQQRRFEQAVTGVLDELAGVARAYERQMGELDARLESWRLQMPSLMDRARDLPWNADALQSPGSLGALSRRLQRLSHLLNDYRLLQEPETTSRIPVLGPLIGLVRRFTNWLAVRWYMAPILDQQRRLYETLTGAFDALADVVVSQGRHVANLNARLDGLSQQPLVQEGQLVAAIRELVGPAQHSPQNAAAIRAVGTDGLEDVFRIPAGLLRAWEEIDLPPGLDTCFENLLTHDEVQDIHFPFSWQDQFYTWPYLFNLAVLGPRLGCRPGDLVLDFAGGSGWVSEFLNRIGIRTVLLDYAEMPLRHSHTRFAADRRLREAAPMYPVRGNGLILPFADETFDGIICLNALHHMASYEAVLAEMARVLKPGCRAVFGEPGELHTRLSTAQWMMRQHRVFEKNVPLPLIYLYAMRSGFSRMWRYPYMYPAQAEFPYPEVGTVAAVLRNLQDLMPESLVGYSLFALEKAGQRPVDSSSPVGDLQQHQLRAEITLLEYTEAVPAGSSFMDRVRITNLGDVVWLAAVRPWGGHVALAVKLCDASGNELGDVLGGQPLPHNLAPGEQVELEVPFTAPGDPGRYVLKYDLTNVGRMWFELWGSKAGERPLVVTPPMTNPAAGAFA